MKHPLLLLYIVGIKGGATVESKAGVTPSY
jgi:hypothetical protein